jgi:hypothetical protein
MVAAAVVTTSSPTCPPPLPGAAREGGGGADILGTLRLRSGFSSSLPVLPVVDVSLRAAHPFARPGWLQMTVVRQQPPASPGNRGAGSRQRLSSRGRALLSSQERARERAGTVGGGSASWSGGGRRHSGGRSVHTPRTPPQQQVVVQTPAQRRAAGRPRGDPPACSALAGGGRGGAAETPRSGSSGSSPAIHDGTTASSLGVSRAALSSSGGSVAGALTESLKHRLPSSQKGGGDARTGTVPPEREGEDGGGAAARDIYTPTLPTPTPTPPATPPSGQRTRSTHLGGGGDHRPFTPRTIVVHRSTPVNHAAYVDGSVRAPALLTSYWPRPAFSRGRSPQQHFGGLETARSLQGSILSGRSGLPSFGGGSSWQNASTASLGSGWLRQELDGVKSGVSEVKRLQAESGREEMIYKKCRQLTSRLEPLIKRLRRVVESEREREVAAAEQREKEEEEEEEERAEEQGLPDGGRGGGGGAVNDGYAGDGGEWKACGPSATLARLLEFRALLQLQPSTAGSPAIAPEVCTGCWRPSSRIHRHLGTKQQHIYGNFMHYRTLPPPPPPSHDLVRFDGPADPSVLAQSSHDLTWALAGCAHHDGRPR